MIPTLSTLCLWRWRSATPPPIPEAGSSPEELRELIYWICNVKLPLKRTVREYAGWCWLRELQWLVSRFPLATDQPSDSNLAFLDAVGLSTEERWNSYIQRFSRAGICLLDRSSYFRPAITSPAGQEDRSKINYQFLQQHSVNPLICLQMACELHTPTIWSSSDSVAVVVEWLIEQWCYPAGTQPIEGRVPIDREQARSLASVACQNNHLPVVQWLVTHLQPLVGDIDGACFIEPWPPGKPAPTTKDYKLNCFYAACAHGRLRIAQWLASRWRTENPTVQAIRFLWQCLLRASYSGHLSLIRWLVDIFQLVMREPSDAVACLQMACQCGHLDLAQWLFCVFDLTVEDVRSNNVACFRLACNEGHLDIIEWLLNQAGLTADDVEQVYAESLLDACRYGSPAMVEWLLRFDQIPPDVRVDGGKHLGLACMHGSLRMAQQLVDHFSLTVDAVRENKCLSDACSNGNLELVRWLVERFELTWHDIIEGNYDCIRQARERDHPEVADWLISTFDVRAGWDW